MGMNTLQINKLMMEYYKLGLTTPSKKISNEFSYLINRDVDITQILYWNIGYADKEWDSDINFLKEKGLTDEDILIAGFSSKSESGKYYDKFRNRIMFPFINEKDEILGFTSRSLDEDNGDYKVAKYLNSSESEIFSKGNIVYGLNRAYKNIESKKCIIVVEGQFDVITAHKCGINNVVACSGTALTDKQLLKMSKYTKNIVLCFDNDKAGKAATIKSISKGINLGINIEVLDVKGGDPDEILRVNNSAFEDLTAINGYDYLINEYLRTKDVSILLMVSNPCKGKFSFLDKLKYEAIRTSAKNN